jgi:hypothetical protein
MPELMLQSLNKFCLMKSEHAKCLSGPDAILCYWQIQFHLMTIMHSTQQARWLAENFWADFVQLYFKHAVSNTWLTFKKIFFDTL